MFTAVVLFATLCTSNGCKTSPVTAYNDMTVCQIDVQTWQLEPKAPSIIAAGYECRYVHLEVVK